MEYLRAEYKKMYGHLLRKRGVDGLFYLGFLKAASWYKQELFKVRIREQNLEPRPSLTTDFTTPSKCRDTDYLSCLYQFFYILNTINYPLFIYFQLNTVSASLPG